jgi:hypothetical protein
MDILYYTIGDDFESFLDVNDLMTMSLVCKTSRQGYHCNSLLNGLQQVKAFDNPDFILRRYPLRALGNKYELYLAAQLLYHRKIIENVTYFLISLEFGKLIPLETYSSEWLVPQACQRCIEYPNLLRTILETYETSHDKSNLYPITPELMDILLKYDPCLIGYDKYFILSYKTSYIKARSSFGKFLYKAFKNKDLNLLIASLQSFNLKVPREALIKYMDAANIHPLAISRLIYDIFA